MRGDGVPQSGSGPALHLGNGAAVSSGVAGAAHSVGRAASREGSQERTVAGRFLHGVWLRSSRFAWL